MLNLTICTCILWPCQTPLSSWFRRYKIVDSCHLPTRNDSYAWYNNFKFKMVIYWYIIRWTVYFYRISELFWQLIIATVFVIKLDLYPSYDINKHENIQYDKQSKRGQCILSPCSASLTVYFLNVKFNDGIYIYGTVSLQIQLDSSYRNLDKQYLRVVYIYNSEYPKKADY